MGATGGSSSSYLITAGVVYSDKTVVSAEKRSGKPIMLWSAQCRDDNGLFSKGCPRWSAAFGVSVVSDTLSLIPDCGA